MVFIPSVVLSMPILTDFWDRALFCYQNFTDKTPTFWHSWRHVFEYINSNLFDFSMRSSTAKKIQSIWALCHPQEMLLGLFERNFYRRRRIRRFIEDDLIILLWYIDSRLLWLEKKKKKKGGVGMWKTCRIEWRIDLRWKREMGISSLPEDVKCSIWDSFNPFKSILSSSIEVTQFVLNSL